MGVGKFLGGVDGVGKEVWSLGSELKREGKAVIVTLQSCRFPNIFEAHSLLSSEGDIHWSEKLSYLNNGSEAVTQSLLRLCIARVVDVFS